MAAAIHLAPAALRVPHAAANVAALHAWVLALVAALRVLRRHPAHAWVLAHPLLHPLLHPGVRRLHRTAQLRWRAPSAWAVTLRTICTAQLGGSGDLHRRSQEAQGAHLWRKRLDSRDAVRWAAGRPLSSRALISGR